MVNKVTGESYVGEFQGNKKQGKGRLIYSDGSVYAGQFDADLPHG